MGPIQTVVSTLEKYCSRFPFLVGLYSRPYLKVVQREINLAKITFMDRVLNVGCGAIPFTAIHVAVLTGAKVWAMDRDIEAVRHARFCLEKMGLMEQVQVMEGDASLCIPVNFTAAIVALQAEPKELIMNNMLAKALPESRLIFRHPCISYEKHYDRLPNRYNHAGQVNHDMQTFDRSLLFVK